jgi:DNA adenine methylase
VVIECLDFAEFIRRYDSKGTLFYLDPPYWGCEGDYGRHLFGRDRFEDLAGVLRALKGRFIMSLNDVSEVREVFAGFHIESVKTTYTIAGKGAQTDRAEVLISNGNLTAS